MRRTSRRRSSPRLARLCGSFAGSGFRGLLKQLAAHAEEKYAAEIIRSLFYRRNTPGTPPARTDAARTLIRSALRQFQTFDPLVSCEPNCGKITNPARTCRTEMDVAGICFRARRTVAGQNGDRRRGVRGSVSLGRYFANR